MRGADGESPLGVEGGKEGWPAGVHLGSTMPSLWLESVLLEGLSGRSLVP